MQGILGYNPVFKITKPDIVCSRYPDHLTHLHGLYGFSKDSDEFNGVRFSS